MTQERVSWKTKIGTVFAFMAATIGLGSLWRFPYKLGAFGGAAFLLIYLILYLLIGISAYNGETLLGKYTKSGPAGAFRKAAMDVGASSKWRIVGDLTVIFGTLLNTQYLVVVGWTIVYFALAISGIIFTTDSVFLNDLWSFVFPGIPSLIGLGLATAYCTISIMKGIHKGIEKVNQILMPCLFILLILGVIRSLTLPSAFQGVVFLFHPEFEILGDPMVWIQALGQVYFTTALGIGFIITYGSYMREDQKVTSNTYMVAIGDNLASILAGLAIFPAVFAFGLNPDSGARLAFIILPQVFAVMPLGRIFGILFFLAFMIAALEATKPAFEVAVSYLVEEYGIDRERAVLVVGGIQFIIGTLSAISLIIWDIFDWMWTLIPPLMGFLTMIFVGWIWKIERIGEKEGINKFWIYLLKYVAPAGIFIVLLNYLISFLQVI